MTDEGDPIKDSTSNILVEACLSAWPRMAYAFWFIVRPDAKYRAADLQDFSFFIMQQFLLDMFVRKKLVDVIVQ